MSVTALVFAAAIVVGQVAYRAGFEGPAGDVKAVGIDGVDVGGAAIGWDRVRSVSGPMATAANEFAAIADVSWRARSRLERADLGGAEPLFESLEDRFRGRTGPMAAMIGEGLVRCRVSRGSMVSAIEPWLMWSAAQGGGELTTSFDESRPGRTRVLLPHLGFAGAMGLVYSLPPVFIDVPATHAFAARGAIAAEFTGSVQAMASLYLAAAAFEAGLPFGVPPDGDRSAGVALVREMVLARVGDEPARRLARDMLMKRLTGDCAPWLEAWVRTALGRSLLKETDLESQRLGVVELLHVPARLENEVPYLTGLALAEAALGARAIGERDGAERLRSELQERFLGHPALDWAPVRIWTPGAARPATGGGGG